MIHDQRVEGLLCLLGRKFEMKEGFMERRPRREDFQSNRGGDAALTKNR